jgi:hypothetical protein
MIEPIRDESTTSLGTIRLIAFNVGLMVECCGTSQGKVRNNKEYKACLRERAILRLLDAPTDENGAVYRYE